MLANKRGLHSPDLDQTATGSRGLMIGHRNGAKEQGKFDRNILNFEVWNGDH